MKEFPKPLASVIAAAGGVWFGFGLTLMKEYLFLIAVLPITMTITMNIITISDVIQECRGRRTFAGKEKETLRSNVLHLIVMLAIWTVTVLACYLSFKRNNV